MREFILASVILLALAGIGLVGCSASVEDNTPPAKTITLGDTTSETIEGDTSQTYEFTAGTSDQVNVQLLDISPGNDYYDLDIDWNGLRICLGSATAKSCILAGVTPKETNQFSISNETSGTITFDLYTKEE